MKRDSEQTEDESKPKQYNNKNHVANLKTNRQ